MGCVLAVQGVREQALSRGGEMKVAVLQPPDHLQRVKRPVLQSRPQLFRLSSGRIVFWICLCRP